LNGKFSTAEFSRLLRFTQATQACPQRSGHAEHDRINVARETVQRMLGWCNSAADLPDMSSFRTKALVAAAAGYFAWGCFRYF
jgi:hypothetical protein